MCVCVCVCADRNDWLLLFHIYSRVRASPVLSRVTRDQHFVWESVSDSSFVYESTGRR